MTEVILITCLFLVLCSALAWWLYYRESTLSGQRNRAEQRALALVNQLLSTREREQLSHRGFLEVASRLLPGRSYRIPRRRGQVQVYEGGRHAGSLCIQPTRWVPDGDLIIMHKLMIEADEGDYLRTANFFRPYRLP